MNKIEHYHQVLAALDDWIPYLLDESALPGPRANLELVKAAADVGAEARFRQLLTQQTDSPAGEFLVVCGVVGLGKLVAEGRTDLLDELRGWASDSRWRVREAVAIGLQRVGKADMALLIETMQEWITGNWLEQRTAAAALCEPVLLQNSDEVRAVLAMLDQITRQLSRAEDRRSDDFKTLRKGMAYCWSVAVVAAPEDGQRLMETWFASDDRDVRWIMKENLKKQRLVRMDSAWVETWRARLRPQS